MSKAPLDLVGIGNAIVDVLSKTPDGFITEHHLPKGGMTLIEADQAKKLYDVMPPGMEMSGGSAANTLAAFASMGGKAGYIGKVANDQLGEVFRHDIKASNVAFTTRPLEDGPSTARCLILITPDAQRTMCTYLGACVWITPADLDQEMIQNAQVTYLEGYLFDRPHAKDTFFKACEMAHAAGRKVALSLSDAFCVERHRDEFRALIKDHVDILFANESEILSLYQTHHFDEAALKVSEECPVVALTRSEKGSLVIAGKERYEVGAVPVAKVVDTTGAGDMYAAGFLYGYTQDLHLKACAELGALAAAEIIQHVGARPQSDLSALVQQKLRA